MLKIIVIITIIIIFPSSRLITRPFLLTTHSQFLRDNKGYEQKNNRKINKNDNKNITLSNPDAPLEKWKRAQEKNIPIYSNFEN